MILSLVLGIVLNILHPIHIGVCDMFFDEEERSLETSIRLFSNDTETAISILNNFEEFDIGLKTEKERDELLENYVRQKLSFKVNGKDKEYKYIGHELDFDIIYVYVELENIRRLKSLEVNNSIFFELFDDQQHFIHLKFEGEKTRSLTLNRKIESDIFQVK